jgi:hypothetical protein
MYLAFNHCRVISEKDTTHETWTGLEFRDLYLEFSATVCKTTMSLCLQRLFKEKVVHVSFGDLESSTQASQLIRLGVLCESQKISGAHKSVFAERSFHINPNTALDAMLATLDKLEKEKASKRRGVGAILCPKCDREITFDVLIRDGCPCKHEHEHGRGPRSLSSRLFDLKCVLGDQVPRNENCFHFKMSPVPLIEVALSRSFVEDFK